MYEDDSYPTALHYTGANLAEGGYHEGEEAHQYINDECEPPLDEPDWSCYYCGMYLTEDDENAAVCDDCVETRGLPPDDDVEPEMQDPDAARDAWLERGLF
jgi:hypothetical protein